MPCFCCSEPWKRGRLLVKQLEDLIAGSASGGGAKVTGGAASELDGSFMRMTLYYQCVFRIRWGPYYVFCW